MYLIIWGIIILLEVIVLGYQTAKDIEREDGDDDN